MRKIKYIFEAITIYFFFLIIKIIGLNLSRKVFAKIFIGIGPLFKSKDIVNDNLDKIFDNKIDINKNKIQKEMWENYGKVFVEYIFLDKFKKDSSHINVVGKEQIENIIQNKESTIFISGHFANFELMSMELTKMGVKLATIYRPLNNFF